MLIRDRASWVSFLGLAGLALYGRFGWTPGQPSPGAVIRPGSAWAGKEVAFLYARVAGPAEGGIRLILHGEPIEVRGAFPPLAPEERVSVRVRVNQDGKLDLVRWQRHRGRTVKAVISALGLLGSLGYLGFCFRWDRKTGGLCPT